MKRELRIITHYGEIIFATFVYYQMVEKVEEICREISGLIPKDFDAQLATLEHDGYEIETIIVETY
ncbi:hypothetical protein BUY98_09405 [Staphylococcus gallinarum]|uniref:hypothetical protein n=1 Tax=Staphylococcus gallinarum TaxID=1293 RepID=UPI000E693851|nr:hypothetical protein [Staphylococcus gallinarum]RIL32657.1 hypothetical protein BUY98_09405 [Staphylococcus gallinarum]